MKLLKRIFSRPWEKAFWLTIRIVALFIFPKRRVLVVGDHTRHYLTWKLFKLSGFHEVKVGPSDLIYKAVDATADDVETFDAINGGCKDISKTRVMDLFAEVFGYSLRVDPTTFDGLMAVKSEENAAHDGQVLQGPMSNPLEGLVYQKLIDSTEDGLVTDLRPCVIGSEIPFVYVKRRPVSARFSNDNRSVVHCDAAQVFSPDERVKILQFVRLMGLDICELDIIRDKTDGRIYIVDVARTPHSPGHAYKGFRGFLCMLKGAHSFRHQFVGAYHKAPAQTGRLLPH